MAALTIKVKQKQKKKKKKQAGKKTDGSKTVPMTGQTGKTWWRCDLCGGGGFEEVFRGRPCPCRLPCGSPTCRSCGRACLDPVTGLWRSAPCPWMTWQRQGGRGRESEWESDSEARIEKRERGGRDLLNHDQNIKANRLARALRQGADCVSPEGWSVKLWHNYINNDNCNYILPARYYTAHVPQILQIPECTAGILALQSAQDAHWRILWLIWCIVVKSLLEFKSESCKLKRGIRRWMNIIT